jgi:predicted Zn-dependent peptidase
LADELLREKLTLPSRVQGTALYMPAVRRVVISVYLRTGSRFEDERTSGISHFLEHMLFRGTELHPSAHTLASAFEDLGGTLNASTASDHGTLTIAVPRESFEPTLALLSEVIKSPLLADIELERGIIREELLDELDEKGQVISATSLGRKLSFPDHPLGAPLGGTLETVNSFTDADLRAHHARTYVGEGLVVAVAGPLEPTRVLASVEKYFSDVPAGTLISGPPIAPPKGPAFASAKHAGSSQTRVYVAHRSPGYRDPADRATEMLLRVLDDGLSTRLYHGLCDEGGLCYDVVGANEAFEDGGVFEIIADTAHERAPRVLEKILAITSDIAAHGPTELEFERALKRARWQLEAVLDDPGEVSDHAAFALLTGTAESADERLGELLSVTRQDVRDVAERIFSREGRAVVAVGLPNASAIQKMQQLAER